MDRKKLVAIILAAVWLLVLGYRYLQPGVAPVAAPADRRSQAPRPLVQQAAVPNLALSDILAPPPDPVRGGRDPFSEGGTRRSRASEQPQEFKKIVSIPAPPMPLLPEPAPRVQPAPTVVADAMIKDLRVFGVLVKNGKKTAFLKKGKEVRPFKIGERVFTTQLRVDKIEQRYVVLRDEAGTPVRLDIDKPESQEKLENGEKEVATDEK